MFKVLPVIVMLGAMPIAASAAPFCLTISGTNPQCIYNDGNACEREAGRQNGACEINPAEIKLPTSRVGEFCVITAGHAAQCGYADGTSCARDARQQQGACAKGAGSLPRAIPDPYDTNAGR